MILIPTNYARLSLAQGEQEQFMVVIGVRGALKETSGMDFAEALSEPIEGLDQVVDELGKERSEQLLRVGREMFREQVIAYAIAL